MSYEKNSITTMPTWVKLPKLNVRYWGESTLRKIVATLKIERMWYARVLVDMDINKGFPNELYFTNEHDKLVTQTMQYESLPIWSCKCIQFGHMNTECRVGIKKNTNHKNLVEDKDGFRPVKPRWVRKSKENKTNAPPNTIDPGIVEQQNQMYTTPCEHVNNIPQKGQENMQTPIGREASTLNISNDFELL